MDTFLSNQRATMMHDPFRRFHLSVTKQGQTYRTTVSLDQYLADLLAVSLGEEPGTRQGHTAVREWLDKSLSHWRAFDPELPVSRQAALLALRQVARPELVKRLNPE